MRPPGGDVRMGMATVSVVAAVSVAAAAAGAAPAAGGLPPGSVTAGMEGEAMPALRQGSGLEGALPQSSSSGVVRGSIRMRARAPSPMAMLRTAFLALDTATRRGLTEDVVRGAAASLTSPAAPGRMA